MRASDQQPDQQGERASDFAPLVTPHLTAMLRVARAMVGTDDAEDAAQEAVTRAWQRRAELRDPAAARSWLLRITVNVCHNWRRDHHTPTGRLALPLSDDPPPSSDPRASIFSGASDPGASDHAHRLDLRQAIARLDTEHQHLIALRYYAELDATEIGTLLGVPAATVRTRLRRALTLLRAQLKGAYRDLAAPAREKGHTDG
jgi:RNA polymerase sigma-70 factor (ECF subfamily)